MSLPVTMWREVERSSWLLCSQVPRKQELNKYEVKARAEIFKLTAGNNLNFGLLPIFLALATGLQSPDWTMIPQASKLSEHFPRLISI